MGRILKLKRWQDIWTARFWCITRSSSPRPPIPRCLLLCMCSLSHTMQLFARTFGGEGHGKPIHLLASIAGHHYDLLIPKMDLSELWTVDSALGAQEGLAGIVKESGMLPLSPFEYRESHISLSGDHPMHSSRHCSTGLCTSKERPPQQTQGNPHTVCYRCGVSERDINNNCVQTTWRQGQDVGLVQARGFLLSSLWEEEKWATDKVSLQLQVFCGVPIQER